MRRKSSCRHAISVWYFRYGVITGASTEGSGNTWNASAGGGWAAPADRTRTNNGMSATTAVFQ